MWECFAIPSNAESEELDPRSRIKVNEVTEGRFILKILSVRRG
jgi:hypothetical protein